MSNFLNTTAYLNELLLGKRIAVVGNALSLFDQSYGKDIDSHDVVVRINMGGPLCFNLTNSERPLQIRDTMKQFYTAIWNIIDGNFVNESILSSHGTKTDIWVLAKVDSEFANVYRNYKNKVSCVINVIDPLLFPKNKHTTLPNDEYLVYHENIELLKTQLNGSPPSTGLKILDLLKDFPYKSVSVYGFDWKTTPTFYDQKIHKEVHIYSLEKKYCEMLKDKYQYRFF
jgi:hypothetical protein